MPINLDSTGTGGISGGVLSYTHTATAGRGAKCLLIAVTGEWSGAPAVTDIRCNGVPGSVLFLQIATGPSYMTCRYWVDAVLPGAGAWTIAAGGVSADCAGGTMLFTGVDQKYPIGSAIGRYVGSTTLAVDCPPVTGQGAVFAAAAVLTSNTLSANAPLQNYTSKNSPNALLGMAWCPSPNILVHPGFTSTGDNRLSMGVVGMREAPPNSRRYYVAPAISPPATPTAPMSADRLYNRSLARIFRRGETG